MLCPFCKTENRDERPTCYHCGADLVILRSVVNAARHHYNKALDHAGRGRNNEAITELRTSLGLDAHYANGWVVLGTLYAKQERFGEAEEAWKRALGLDERLNKAHDYLDKLDRINPVWSGYLRLRRVALSLLGVVAILCIGIGLLLSSPWMLRNYAELGDWIQEKDGRFGIFIGILIAFSPILVAFLVRFLDVGKSVVREGREVLKTPKTDATGNGHKPH